MRGYVVTFLVDIALLDDGEFPEGDFDGEKLLECAKGIDAEISAH